MWDAWHLHGSGFRDLLQGVLDLCFPASARHDAMHPQEEQRVQSEKAQANKAAAQAGGSRSQPVLPRDVFAAQDMEAARQSMHRVAAAPVLPAVALPNQKP